MDREEMMNELTGTDQPDTTAADSQTAADDTAPDAGAGKPEAAPEAPAPLAGKETAALLDAISEPDPNAKPAPAAEPAGDTPAEGEGKEPPAEKPDTAPDAPKTPEQEAEDLIKEMGVKSERGQDRIRSVFAKVKETEAKATALETDVNEFREMVTSTGMAPQEFAQMLEVGRLIKSNEPANLKAALELIDGQRAAIAKQLGVAVPGVDPLDDFPDLKAKVEAMEITPETALELAKYKRQEQTQQQSRQAEQRQQQGMQEFQQSITQAAQTAEAYFATRKHEADYPAKMARIHAYFKDPAKMQDFVQTYQPNQWFAQFKFMYDNMSVPQAAAARDPQPLRSRSVTTGSAAPNPNEPLSNRLMSHIDSLGI